MNNGMNLTEDMIEAMFGEAANAAYPPVLSDASQTELLLLAFAAISDAGDKATPKVGSIVRDTLGELSPFKISNGPMILLEMREPFYAIESVGVDPHTHQAAGYLDCVVGTIQHRQTEEGGFQPALVSYLYDSRLLVAV